MYICLVFDFISNEKECDVRLYYFVLHLVIERIKKTNIYKQLETRWTYK